MTNLVPQDSCHLGASLEEPPLTTHVDVTAAHGLVSQLRVQGARPAQRREQVAPGCVTCARPRPEALTAPAANLARLAPVSRLASMPSVLLATAGYDHTIRMWEASNGKCYHKFQFLDSVSQANLPRAHAATIFERARVSLEPFLSSNGVCLPRSK